MKKLCFRIGASFLLLLFPLVLLADVPPPEIQAAAEFGLARYLTEIPPAELVNFGFAEGEATGPSRVGDPWQLYTITPEALLLDGETAVVEDLITPTGLWYFPVFLDGTARVIITVDRMDGRWEAVAFGATPLAGELEKISRQWPKASGYTPKLVAIYQAAAYFFTVPEKNPRNFTPLTFDGLGFGGYFQKSLPEYSTTTDLFDLIGPLREAVEANIAAHQPAGEGEGE